MLYMLVLYMLMLCWAAIINAVPVVRPLQTQWRTQPDDACLSMLTSQLRGVESSDTDVQLAAGQRVSAHAIMHLNGCIH